MSSTIKQCINTFKIVSDISDSQTRKKAVECLCENGWLYKALREIALNIVRKNIPLNLNQKKKLKRYRKSIYKLAITKSNRKNKKLVSQVGGFLPILVPALISLLSDGI